jgi:hypothetical protein
LPMPVRILLILIAFFFLGTASAEELPEYGLSVKGLGMGNAYTGHASGHDAINYNPAAFARMQGLQFRLMGLGVGLNGLDSYDEYADIFDNSDDVAATLNALYGRPVWARLDYQASLSAGPFIVGAYARNNLSFTLTNPALPYLDTNLYSDLVLFGGTGVQIIPQIFEIGFMAKRITRYASAGDITASTLAHLDSDFIETTSNQTGVAYGVDVGAKLTLPGDWHPSVGFAWQDIGDTKFSFSATNPAPQTIENRMNLALGMEKDFFGVAKLRPAVEFKMLNGSSTDVQIGKKLHAGLELELPILTLRGGFNQGYYTYGASFDFWFFQVDAASYAVELGEYVGQQEDRRYIIQLTMDFGVDPKSGDWFNFSKYRQSARRLKQRR